MADQQKSSNTTGTGLDITVAVLVLIFVIGAFTLFSGQLKDVYSGFTDWIFSGFGQQIYTGAAFIFALLDALLLAFIIFVIYLFRTLEHRLPEEHYTQAKTVEPKEEIHKEWEQLRGLANSSSPSDWNMAIIRADALLDDALQHAGYEGETIAERLKIVDPTRIKSLDRVWSAHRLRNAIAHDPLEQHTKETIIYALRSYQEALRELGLMT